MMKVMISIPERLLDAVDKAAEKRDVTRSAFIREALHQKLAGDPPTRRKEAMAALRQELNKGAWVAEDLVRSERDR